MDLRKRSLLVVSVIGLALVTVASSHAPKYDRIVAESESPKPYSSLRQESVSYIVNNEVDMNSATSFEGFDSTVYWPGGASGPTIGSGLDLGCMGKEMQVITFRGLLSDKEMALIRTADGLSGSKAQAWVARHRLTLPSSLLNDAFNRVAADSWVRIKANHPKVMRQNMQTRGVVLALAINYGYTSKALSGVYKAVDGGSAVGIASEVGRLAKCGPAALKARRESEAKLVQVSSQNKKASIDYD